MKAAGTHDAVECTISFCTDGVSHHLFDSQYDIAVILLLVGQLFELLYAAMNFVRLLNSL